MEYSVSDEAVASQSVSAIVVSYFTGPLLARAIASLVAQPQIRQIIIVDNGNWEGAIAEAVEGHQDLVTIISGHGNIGFAAACNLGARHASEDFLLFLNPDAVLPANSVAKLLKDSAELPRAWMLGAKLVDRDGVEQQGGRRMTLTPWRAFVEVTRLYKLAPRHPYFRRFNLHSDPCPDKVIAVPVVSGACFFLWKKDYFDIGGMDENYFLHVEDIDFCLRFGKAGGGVYFTPNVAVLHQGGSSRVNPIQVEARKTVSMLRYFRTHFSDAYPTPFLWFMSGLLWGVFALKFIARAIGKVLRLIGVRARRGAAGVKRAKEISDRRSIR